MSETKPKGAESASDGGLERVRVTVPGGATPTRFVTEAAEGEEEGVR